MHADPEKRLKCDILFRGGRIVDGGGDRTYFGDVAVSQDRIVAVGNLDHMEVDCAVDCHGLYLAPGFIDAHSHADSGLIQDALASALPLITQGITTVVINPDGFGPIDLKKQRKALETHGTGVNTVPMVPHGSIRRHVVGMADRQATPEELELMKDLVRTGMEHGAFGLSSGLFYTPACFAPTDELVALAEVVAEYRGVHTSHIRDESDYSVGLLTAVDELIDISRRAKLPGIITHIKALGPHAWGSSKEIVRRVEAARAQGLEIWADQYPYEASSTHLSSALVPRWALDGGREAMLRRFEDTRLELKLVAGIRDNLKRRGGASRITLHSYTPRPEVEGQTLQDIASLQGVDPAAVVITLLKQGEAGIISFCMLAEDVTRLMKQPWTMVCTDGDLLPFESGTLHPRCYGTFPRRIFQYVVQENVTSLEQAVRAMTALPAQVFRIKDRGMLRTGAFADIVAFELETLRDKATFQNPHQYSEGVVHLLINGKFAIKSNQAQHTRAGRVLSRGR